MQGHCAIEAPVASSSTGICFSYSMLFPRKRLNCLAYCRVWNISQRMAWREIKGKSVVLGHLYTVRNKYCKITLRNI